MIQIEYLALVLTGLGLTASILYYTIVLRNQNKTRQAQLLMQLYSQYNNKEFMEDYANSAYLAEYEDLEDWNRKYGIYTNLPAYTAWARIGRYFDGAGILVKQGLIDLNLVSELLREPVIYAWESMSKWVYWQRELIDTPEVWANFEYLYKEIRKIHPQTKNVTEMLAALKGTVEKETSDP